MAAPQSIELGSQTDTCIETFELFEFLLAETIKTIMTS